MLYHRISGILLVLAAAPQLLADDARRNAITIPGMANDHAFLGSIYKTTEKKIVNQLCAKGEFVDSLGDVESIYELKSDMSFVDAFKTINGSIDGEANFPLVRVSAGAHLAQTFADTSSSRSFHMYYRVKPKKRVIDPETIWLTEYGKRVVESGKDLYDACGDSFLTGKEYGGSIHANLRFDFRNEYDKDNIGGHIDVGFGPGDVKVVKLNGSLDYLNEKAKNSVVISMKVHQFGGDPTQLSKVIVPGAIHCKLDNASKCLEAFEAVSRYARDVFPTQFDSLDKYNTAKYFANTYKEMGIDKLVPSKGYPQMTELTQLLLQEIETKYQQQILYRKQAGALLSQHSGAMKTNQKTQLETFKEDTFHNSQILARLSRYCYDKPFLDHCVDKKDVLYPQLREVDPSILSLAAPKTKFYKCENARLAVSKTGTVPEEELLRYRKTGWAPIFEDNNHPATVNGFLPCKEAIPTYGPYFENGSE